LTARTEMVEAGRDVGMERYVQSCQGDPKVSSGREPEPEARR
jgi:hypothetical protein